MIAFDARAAEALIAGNHLTFELASGLRLAATVSTQTWVYRYKSQADGMPGVDVIHVPMPHVQGVCGCGESHRITR